MYDWDVASDEQLVVKSNGDLARAVVRGGGSFGGQSSPDEDHKSVEWFFFYITLSKFHDPGNNLFSTTKVPKDFARFSSTRARSQEFILSEEIHFQNVRETKIKNHKFQTSGSGVSPRAT